MSIIKLGVISDTHLGPGAVPKKLAASLDAVFDCVYKVLHAGDLIDLDVITMLAAPRELVAVRGNMDPLDNSPRLLPKQRIITIDGIKIGMTHGSGAPEGLAERVMGAFSESVDVIVFGHSHEPYCRRHGNILLFNPGSASDLAKTPKPTAGILEINNGHVTGSIIELYF